MASLGADMAPVRAYMTLGQGEPLRVQGEPEPLWLQGGGGGGYRLQVVGCMYFIIKMNVLCLV